MQQNVRGPSISTPPAGASFEDYKYGRLPIPPFLYGKRMSEFIYGVDFPNPGNLVLGFAPVQRQSVQLDRDSHFLWEGLSITNTFQNDGTNLWGETTGILGTFFHIYNQSLGTSYSNVAVSSRNMAGAGYNTHYFKDPVLLGPAEILAITYGEINGAFWGTPGAGPFHVTFLGRKVYGVTETEYQQTRKRQWYIYSCSTPTGAGAGATFPSTGAESISYTQVYSDSDFLVRRLSAVDLIFNIAGAAISNGFDMEVMLNVRVSQSGRSFFNKKVNVRNIAGGRICPQFALGNTAYGSFLFPASIPFPFEAPLLVNRNTTLEIRAEVQSPNIAPGTAINAAWLNIEGCKIYD